MNIEFKLPELGENIAVGDVVNVLVEEGEPIAANQGVCELETDKAVVEIPCPHAGRVVKIHIHKGDTVSVGQTLITLDADGDGKPAEAETAPSRKPAPAAQTVVAAAAVRRGRRRLTAVADAAGRAAAVSPGRHAGRSPDHGGAPVPAGPATRRLARQMGVDLRRVHGSGPGGRITPEDVQAAFAAARTPQAPPPPPARRSAAGHFAGAGGAAGRAGPGRLGPGPPREDVQDPPHDRRADVEVGQHHPPRDQLRRRRRHRAGADPRRHPQGASSAPTSSSRPCPS